MTFQKLGIHLPLAGLTAQLPFDVPVMSASLQDFREKNTQFLEWFKTSGGTLHEAVGIAHFEGTGRGAVALEDIAVRTTRSPGVG